MVGRVAISSEVRCGSGILVVIGGDKSFITYNTAPGLLLALHILSWVVSSKGTNSIQIASLRVRYTVQAEVTYDYAMLCYVML
jgi:hypothetical protein